MASRGPRRKVSCFGALLILLALTAIVAGAAVYAYTRYLRYERVAAHHVPRGSVFAARVDVQQGVLYEPVRRHWVPLLGEALGDTGQTSERLRRFEERSGLRRIDLREIVVAVVSGGDWVAVVSGLFPKAEAVQRIHDALTAEGATSWQLAPDGRTLTHPGARLALSQAADGAIVLASSPGALAAALPAQSSYRELGLPVEPAAGLAVRGEVLRDWAGGPLLMMTPGLRALAQVAKLTGSVQLGDRLTVEVLVHPVEGGDPGGLQSGVEGGLSALRTLARLDPRPDVAGERAALERARVRRTDEGHVAVSFEWDRTEVERGAQAAAELMRAVFFTPQAP